MNKLQSGLLAATIVLTVGLPLAANAQNVVLTLDNGPCVVPLEDSSAVTVSADGDITVDVDDANLPSCFGTQGSIDVILAIEPTSINSGESVDVSWSVAGFIEGVTTCVASGGASDWVDDVDDFPSGGSGTYTLNTTTTFNLSCQNAGDADATQVIVTGGGGGGGGLDSFPDPPAFCGPEPAGRELPFDIFKDFQSNPPNGSPKRTYADVWESWPGNNGATVFIPNGKYVAMPFYSNLPLGDSWRMTWVGGPANGNSTTVTVSRCPGDFSGVGYSSPFCKVTSGTEGKVFLALIGSGAGAACYLTGGTNEIYYFNIRHTNGTGANGCSDAVCQFLGQPD